MAVAEEQARNESRLRLILEINRKINSSLDLNEVLNFIVEAVHIIIPYDAAGIYLFDSSNQTVTYFVGRGYGDSEQAEMSVGCVEGLIKQVISTGESVLVPEVVGHPHDLHCRRSTRSQLTVPIVSDGSIIGAFNLESDRPGRFTEEDLRWLAEVATQAAMSIDKAILHQELIEKKRLEEELRIAREVQLSLLPRAAVTLEGVDVAGVNIPSQAVGGDYFDFIPIVQGQLGLVVADVVGKGIPAALIMAGFRAFLRAEIRNNYAIRTIFAKVNNLLHESLKEHQFVSAIYGVLDLGRRRLTYSNAGHLPGILFQREGQRYLKSGGLVLGVLEGASYNERFVDLEPGNILLLYTDGLVEAENSAGEEFGRQRVEQFVRANEQVTAHELCQGLYAEMRRFTEGRQLKDDTTILVAKVLPTVGEASAG